MTYVAFRAAFLLLGVTFLLLPRGSWPAIPAPRGLSFARGQLPSAFLLVIGVVALPLIAFSVRQPDAFGARVRWVSVMAAEQPGKALWRGAALTGQMFFTSGDANPRHSHRKAPVLPPAVSPFFGLGLALALRHAFRPRESERAAPASATIQGDRRRAAFVLCWMVIMALPVVLTGRGVPHALRSIGMLPAAHMLAACGLLTAARAAGRFHRRAALPVVICAATAAAAQGYRAYFVDWGRDPFLGEESREDLVEKARYLETRSAASRAYVIANGRGLPVPYPDGPPMPAQTLLFLLHDHCTQPVPAIACPTFVRPEHIETLAVDSWRPNAFLLLKDDAPEASQLARRFPHGVWRRLGHSALYAWPR
jgi:hypothetical protein